MPAWDVNKGKKNVVLKMDGNTTPYEFDENNTLGQAIKEVAQRAGLTAVNVLENGQELSQENAAKPLKSFKGTLTVVPKDSGSTKGKA